MPIIDVEVVGDAWPPASTQRLADELGTALSSHPGGTWVRVRQLDQGSYAENGGLPDAVLPVFVTVLERIRPSGQELTERVSRITLAVAEVIGRDPENVHVLYEVDAAGRLAFGGRLVE